jgi:hypothetical protein
MLRTLIANPKSEDARPGSLKGPIAAPKHRGSEQVQSLCAVVDCDHQRIDDDSLFAVLCPVIVVLNRFFRLPSITRAIL